MSLPDYFFISSNDGCLYDTRTPAWHKRAPLRHNYKQTHRTINTTADLKATLRAGEYAWPGGYQMYFRTNDGHAVSFEGVRKNVGPWLKDIRERTYCRIVAVEINYEDQDLYCVITDKPIPPSYGA